MSRYHAIIRAPLITEKNTSLRGSQNKFVFKVMKKATKPQIKRAVETLFNVKVLSVNTVTVRGKRKRMGRHVGYQPDTKKAVVKLAEGQSIAAFGEV